MSNLRTVFATRYITPLREGGSLPAVVEADDGKMYVVKFRGAGQGPKALVAEVIAGEIARCLGLHVPELVQIEVDSMLGRSEPNEEIRDLINASVGLNLGMGYLSGAFAFNPLLTPTPDPLLAATIVWLDAYTLNVDRTARNVNLLLWEKKLWCIDHGAALYFQHDWTGAADKVRSPFAMIKQHVLLPFAAPLSNLDQALRQRVGDDVLRAIVDLVPSNWLQPERLFADEAAQRDAYWDFLVQRRQASSLFVMEADRVRTG